MFAAGGGHNDTTRFLLDQKADVNIVVQATPEYIERVAKVIDDTEQCQVLFLTIVSRSSSSSSTRLLPMARRM